MNERPIPPSVTVNYPQTGASTRSNEMGMRAMQERAYQKRGEQYLLSIGYYFYSGGGDPAQLAFAIKNAAKDVGYYSTMTNDAGISSIMSQSTLQALKEAQNTGRGEQMVSQMVDFYSEKMKP